MDNLQRHYLGQLEAAMEYALHGDIEGSKDICFELRLKPDLAFYTRAQVNLLMTDILDIQEYPETPNFAKEALRLALELEVVEKPSATPFWATRYDRLKQDAEAAVQRTEAEEKEVTKSREEEQKAKGLPKSESGALAYGIKEMSLEPLEFHEATSGQWVEVDQGDDLDEEQIWNVECAFTYFPADQPSHVSESSMGRSTTSSSASLPPLPPTASEPRKADNDDDSQLLTPPPSQG